MGTTEKRPHPERDRTDQSLTTERQTADSKWNQRRERQEEEADEVVRRARERANFVLRQARKRADDLLGPGEGTSEAQQRVLDERDEADEVLRLERLLEDERLSIEREQWTRQLQERMSSERAATNRDLGTERSLADQSLASHDAFLGLVSHELRGALNGIALQAAVLITQASSDESGRRVIERADKIERCVARMKRLIDDLADLASIEAGRLRITTRRDDVARLAHEAVATFEPAAAAKGVQLVLEAPGDSVPAKFDHDRILQVLTNLLDNAVKFTSQGGNIVVRVEPKGEYVRVSASDTGSGIAGDKLNVIFERFGQAAHGDRPGVGLGLFIAKSIINAHGGEIGVESRPSEGSTFFFTLPAARAEEAEGAGGVAASSMQSSWSSGSGPSSGEDLKGPG